jgi:hypothetical protein
MIQQRPARARAALAAALALLLAGCGGGGGNGGAGMPTPPVAQTTRVDLLASAARGIESIAFDGDTAYAALSNSSGEGTAVLKTALPLRADARWTDVALGACALPKSDGGMPLRAPGLRMLGSTLWLFQPWYDDAASAGQHALCALDASRSTFVARDQALESCIGGYCSTLWMSDLKQAGNRLYTNAGAGPNLFVSADGAAGWRVLLGQFDAMTCTHSAFGIVGDRVLVGGECPLDMAFIRAYQLSPDGLALASKDPLPLTLPNLENRNVQFIQGVTGSQRVFAGVEGGLLRSEDGGRSFKFVIEEPVEGNKHYPYIGAFLALSTTPDTLVAGGFDKATGKPYLAWSADGGVKWTDISALLPGYARAADAASSGAVTAIAEDPQGRIVVGVNEREHADGRLLLLTLARP